MPFHTLASRTCTFARFLRIDDAAACAAAHRGWERTNRPEWSVLAKGDRETAHAAKASGAKHTCPERPPAVTLGDAFETLVAGDW
jgi:hypothetical protein